MTIYALGYAWPYTGRKFPDGARLATRTIHPKWLDLVWLNEATGYWTYISTLSKKLTDHRPDEPGASICD